MKKIKKNKKTELLKNKTKKLQKNRPPKKKEKTKAKVTGKTYKVFGIRVKIFACFLIPIACMLVLGWMSYNKAAQGLNNNFQDFSMQTIATSSDYIELGDSFVETEALKYITDTELSSYFKGKLENDASQKREVVERIRKQMMATQVGNEFISNMYIVTKEDVNMITMSNHIYAGIYEEFKKETDSDTNKNSVSVNWMDHHEKLDEYMGIDPNSYIMSYQLPAVRDKAIMVVDIKPEKIQELLEEMDMGDGSIVGYVTEGGREISVEHKEKGAKGVLKEGETVFADKDFYKKSKGENKAVRVQFKGTEYVYLHKTSEETGATTCALVPYEHITANAVDIRNMTVQYVVLASIVAILIGTLIANGIRKNMKVLAKNMKQVADGNLTTQVSVRGYDEFQSLAQIANHMIGNNKNLVQHVQQATGTLEESAKEVSETSGVIQTYSERISNAIDEINNGMERQSRHAEKCVEKTGSLSEKIQDVSATAHDVEKLVEQSKGMIYEGMQIVQMLGERAQETTQSTDQVEKSIDGLKKESKIINEFVQTITEISDQTNLLSLNANIEAARAGEAGKGFAVVAEEIWKLAADSASAAEKISENVENIRKQTQESVESAKQAKRIVALQTDAVQKVTEVFTNMNASMELLFDALTEILENTELADEEQKATVEAVQRISEIIKDTADSAAVVSDIATNLQENVVQMNQTAENLDQNMEGLKKEISVFKIE
ncbi:MAG: methyl-accepting chemotaxis protein [Lachnospiraceae bacterium]